MRPAGAVGPGRCGGSAEWTERGRWAARGVGRVRGGGSEGAPKLPPTGGQAGWLNLVLALLLVYLVMAALFESLLHPFAIMLALPFAFVGIAWISLLTHSPFNLMAQIGLLIQIGIVVNNGIVLVYHIHYYPLARTVIGGLAASTLLTLILVPCLYTLLEDGRALVGRVWRTGPRGA